MGSYFADGITKRKVFGGVVTALKEFVQSFPGAAEIELVDLEKMKENTNLPMIFFMLNVSLDSVIDDLREKAPEMCPPVKEHKRETKAK